MYCRRLGVGVTALLLLGLGVGPAAAAGTDGPNHHAAAPHARTTGSAGTTPAGPGTVKIHQVAGDRSPHNQPHVTCAFYAAFFGFNAGETATVTLAGQAPTGPGHVLSTQPGYQLNPRSTRGAGDTWDSELAFTTSGITALGPPAHQGYHLRLSVTPTGGQTKTKVFWVTPCAFTTTVAAAGLHGAALAPSQRRQPTVRVLGERLVRPRPALPARVGSRRPSTRVLGLRLRRSGALPFTGADVTLLSGLAVFAVLAGAATVVAARRASRAPYRGRHAAPS
jgi:hypothetical protein